MGWVVVTTACGIIIERDLLGFLKGSNPLFLRLAVCPMMLMRNGNIEVGLRVETFEICLENLYRVARCREHK